MPRARVLCENLLTVHQWTDDFLVDVRETASELRRLLDAAHGLLLLERDEQRRALVLSTTKTLELAYAAIHTTTSHYVSQKTLDEYGARLLREFDSEVARQGSSHPRLTELQRVADKAKQDAAESAASTQQAIEETLTQLHSSLETIEANRELLLSSLGQSLSR